MTTRKPARERSVAPSDVRASVKSGRSILLVFGLGPHGLPKEVFEMCEKHLDITTAGMSLETCTALGAVIGSLQGR